MRERKEETRRVAREFIYDYLLTHPCEECGERDVRVLEFHHTGEKDMAVAYMVSADYLNERIQAEINKCTILWLTVIVG